jgi:transposase
VVSEARDGYASKLILALHQAGYPVHLTNARQVRNFAKCKGYLARTDSLDAKLIQAYARASSVKENHQSVSVE